MADYRIKTVLRVISFICILYVLLKISNYYLYNDNSYTRVMMHELMEQENIDLVFAGSSAAYRHFNPQIWDKTLHINTYNIGTSGQRPEGTYYFLKDIFDLYNPKYVIYAQSAFVYTEFEDWDAPTKDYIVYDYMPFTINKLSYGLQVFHENYLIESELQFARNRNNDLLKQLSEVYEVKKRTEYVSYDYNVYGDTSVEALYPKGFVTRKLSLTNTEVGFLSTIQFDDYPVRQQDVFYIQKIADLCSDNDCQLILVVPPMHYGSMANYYDYQVVADFNTGIAERIDAPIFDYSLAKKDYLDMRDDYYYDWAHMSGEGADYFSGVCAELIKKYISGEEVKKEEYFYSSYEELLDATPWIYNVWIVKEDDYYTALCNHGNGVNPLYSFWGSTDNGTTWEIIQDYSTDDILSVNEVDKKYNMLMVKARPDDSQEEYQQLYRMSLE